MRHILTSVWCSPQQIKSVNNIDSFALFYTLLVLVFANANSPKSLFASNSRDIVEQLCILVERHFHLSHAILTYHSQSFDLIGVEVNPPLPFTDMSAAVAWTWACDMKLLADEGRLLNQSGV